MGRRALLPTLGALGALAALGAAGCGGGTEPKTTPPPPASTLELSVAGYVERSGVVTLSATRDNADVPAEQLTFTADPAAAVQSLGGGAFRLLSVGAVRVIARASDGVADTVSLTVKAPPTIVFDRLVGANRDIYKVALDGQELVQLTTDARDDRRPTVAGGTVVFTRFVTNAAGALHSDLFSVPLAGGAEQRVTDTPDLDENEPALSPNGARLAYTRADATGLPRLWLSNVSGTGAAAAATGIGTASTVDATPRWGPAGDRVIYVSTATGTAQLYVLPIIGGTAAGTAAQLGVGPGPNVEPAWSADGAAVAFTSARASGVGLYRATIGVPIAVVWLAAGQAGEAVWLSDGRLVYTDYGTGSTPRLRWIDPADPSAVHEIDTGSGAAAHPAAVPAAP